MKEILQELNAGNSVLIEIDKLDEFLDYSQSQPDYYSYMLEYSETLVKITIIGKDTIVKAKP